MSNTQRNIEVVITGDDSKFRSTVKSSEKATVDFQKHAMASAAVFKGAFAADFASGAIAKTSDLIYQAGAAVVDYSAKMEQTKIGFATLMGGAESANEHLKELEKFAAQTPFDFPTLTDASRRFQNVGIEASKVIPIMTSVGDAVAAAGGSAQTLDSVTVAISQIAAKGKVSAEEINQLAEAGVGGWRILSDQLGKSTADVMDLAQKGQISSDVFLKAFDNFSRQNYGDAMKKQSETFTGAMSTIEDSVMTTAAKAFEPLFKEVSGLAIDLSKEVQANGGDLEAVGTTIAKYIAKGTGKLGAIVWADFMADLSDFANGKKDVYSPVEFGADIYDAFFNQTELNKKIAQASPELKKVDGDVKKVGKSSKEAADEARKLARELDFKKQADEAKKLSKEINDMARNLSAKVLFFGDETEVAATKQQLLTKGVVDFNSAQAKSVLGIAANIDKLKDRAKAEEKAADQFKKWIDELGASADRAFDNFLPDQSDLAKFDSWAAAAKRDMSDFKTEIASSSYFLERVAQIRDLIKGSEDYKAFLDTQKRFTDLSKSVEATTKDIFLGTVQMNSFEEQLLSIAKSANLATREFQTLPQTAKGTLTAFDVTDIGFVNNTKSFVDKYKAQLDTNTAVLKQMQQAEASAWEAPGGITQAQMDAQNNAFRAYEKQATGSLEKIRLSYVGYLKSLTTLDAAGKEIPLFTADYQFDSLIDRFLHLDTIVKKDSLQQGIVKIDDALQNLGLTIGTYGAESEFDKFNKMLADPAMTSAIEARAKALGYTADQLKDVMTQAANAKYSGEGTSTRPRVVGEKKKEDHPFMDGLLGGSDRLAKFTSEADYMKAVYADLESTAGAAMGSMIEGGAQLLEQWIMTGEVSGQAIAQMTASVIAGVASQAAVKSIFEVAEGLAALAGLNPASAAGHFAAAKTYGIVALGATALGAGIGAAGGLGGKKDKSSSNNSSNPSEYFQNNNDSRNMNYLRQSQNGSSGYQQMNSRLEERMSELSGTIKELKGHIGSFTPGDVLTNAIKQRPGLVTETVNKELGKNSTTASTMGRRLGLK